MQSAGSQATAGVVVDVWEDGNVPVECARRSSRIAGIVDVKQTLSHTFIVAVYS